ncbi:hypothetical protein [Dyadobacter frigoris]|uniref:Uncharacterized protein n=1 Tax=Dyadobacter frigoris TaxID=2576211 RepID=A0A4U6DAQ8_9BACT|nr:hypothetical protein [Dyadobacter frigoris]TKT93407.1 hypothetical protein FDK13_06035 [Dyadobacter frigoris]GLU54720.1 hypothetical protein Dfri01_41810 [Dyadobacter frigoris]
MGFTVISKTKIQQGIRSREFVEGVHARKLALPNIALIEEGMMISKVAGQWDSFELVLETVELLTRVIETKARKMT